MPETGFSDTTTKTTPRSVVYGDEPDSPYEYEVTVGNTKVVITSVTGTSGDITIAYTMENDESDASSIKPQYSTTGEDGTYSEMTQGSGGSGKNNIAASPTGASITFVWDTVTDLGIDYRGDVHIKIIAYDRNYRKGSKMESDPWKVSINNAPEAPTLVSPTDGYFRKDQTPQFIFTIPDPRAGNSDMHFKVELDTVDTFDSDNLIVFESRLDQVGWEYDTTGGGVYDEVPFAGIDITGDPTLIGNYVRFTVQTPDRIERKNYYWRAIAGGVL